MCIRDRLIAIILYGIALFCFSAAITLYDKILIFISSPSTVSKISGYGYSIGYLGGGTLFVINSFMVLNPSFFGLEDNVSAIKWSFVSVGIWWAIFFTNLFGSVFVYFHMRYLFKKKASLALNDLT